MDILECEICFLNQSRFIKCNICNRCICDKCYLKLVVVIEDESNKDLLFKRKCPFCRDDEPKNIDDIDKNAVYTILKNTYKNTDTTTINNLESRIEEQQEEINILRNRQEEQITEVKRLLTISKENEINNLKNMLNRYEDKYKIFLKSPETKQSLKELKIMGGFYDKDLNKWWIYKDNKNKNTILKTFKKLTTK